MQRALPLSIIFLMFCNGVLAADIRYISDTQYIPLRTGPGNDYRVIHNGLPSGTRLKVSRSSKKSGYSEVTTDKGTSGWVRTQYLMKELPAKNKLDAALAKAEALSSENIALKAEAETLANDRVALLNQVNSTEGNLDNTAAELARIKQVSGNAVQLDIDMRRLTLETEELRSEGEKLKAENLRLQDNLDNEAFLNGAFAVVLGVIVALVVPRLWPRRRNGSSWA